MKPIRGSGLTDCMAMDFETLVEGAPAYGVVDARDGVVLYAREGHEAEFEVLAAEVLDSAGDGFEVIPLGDGPRCDRLFVAPLREERSFHPADGDDDGPLRSPID